MINYLILNELSPQQLAYDQDAIRSRRFILEALGASFNFIAICFMQCFPFVDLWIFTWIYFSTFLKINPSWSASDAEEKAVKNVLSFQIQKVLQTSAVLSKQKCSY